MSHRTLALWLASAALLSAHPQLSPLVVEAEFSAQHEVILSVNLDPRLLLTDQPAALPSTPAAWYLDQDNAARAKTAEQVRQYVKKTLAFKIGVRALEPKWEITAIDGASNLPLVANSAETHLLLTFKGTLPATAGDFKLMLDPKCAVGLILLNSHSGKDERRPQSLFPGEMSRAFPLPAFATPASATKPSARPDRNSPIKAAASFFIHRAATPPRSCQQAACQPV